ncbi:hypothetical protein KFE25_009035 [Diacronema lutheri]|uniref:Uncharacterized protein n=1 Tax=Diacronema lutheri TaxID=2081491 RepID=A0A8J5Y427_DIALT|nr:hypothetical protein KFE25_009035 [Diacronema lutheri]
MLAPVLERFDAVRLAEFEACNPELKASTRELWRAFCRTTPPPRDGPIDWRAVYNVEKGVHKTLLKQAARRLTARAADADDTRTRLVVLAPGADASGSGGARASGAAPGVGGKRPLVLPRAAASSPTAAVAQPARSKPLCIEACLGAQPQVLAGHKRRPANAPPPTKRPRLDRNGKLILEGCGPTMRSAKLLAPLAKLHQKPPAAAAPEARRAPAAAALNVRAAAAQAPIPGRLSSAPAPGVQAPRRP